MAEALDRPGIARALPARGMELRDGSRMAYRFAPTDHGLRPGRDLGNSGTTGRRCDTQIERWPR